MKILSQIWELKFSNLWRLLLLGAKNPLLVFPTNRATIRTVEICNRIYGSSHHGDNRANAFRHALWNILVAKQVFKIVKTEERAISWAEKITTLHEILMPNAPLETEMDLHNNEMGRKFYLELQNTPEAEIIQFVKAKTEEAVQIKTVGEIANSKDFLVYIEE